MGTLVLQIPVNYKSHVVSNS